MVRASTRWQKGGDKLEKEIDPFLVQEDAVTERKNKLFNIYGKEKSFGTTRKRKLIFNKIIFKQFISSDRFVPQFLDPQ